MARKGGLQSAAATSPAPPASSNTAWEVASPPHKALHRVHRCRLELACAATRLLMGYVRMCTPLTAHKRMPLMKRAAPLPLCQPRVRVGCVLLNSSCQLHSTCSFRAQALCPGNPHLRIVASSLAALEVASFNRSGMRLGQDQALRAACHASSLSAYLRTCRWPAQWGLRGRVHGYRCATAQSNPEHETPA